MFDPKISDSDKLFDIYLRPLRSHNARKIFMFLVQEGKSLTTLDLQSKLRIRGIHLSKKEINGWLHSLQQAKLARKGDQRGKPTTISYDDKYSFDLWTITDLGKQIAKIFTINLKTVSFDPEINAEKKLREVSKLEPRSREKILKQWEENHLLATILRMLFESRYELNEITLRKRIGFKASEVKATLSKYSDLNRGDVLIVKKPGPTDLLTKILRVFSLSSDELGVYALTEEGIKLTNALWTYKK
ncbi:hypothetical protein [[Eubacterium] cellulosolvens]